MSMEPFVRGFIRASLLWFGTGVLLGLSMALFPMQAAVYRPAHMHANLLGFVSMMIFGVAYHVIPRFTGNPLTSRPLARIHFVVANVGLAALVGGWITRAHWPAVGAPLVVTGALLSAVGAFLFIYNLWHTLQPASLPSPSIPAGMAAGRPGRSAG